MTRQLRILALPRYGRLGASSRLRFYQFLPALRAAGFDFYVAPLFDDDYVRDLQRGTRRPASIARSYLRRIATLVSRRGHDLIWLEKEALPWLPWPIERLFIPRGTPIVVDYDDAVFLPYEQHCSGLVRGLLGGKHRAIMRAARTVVAGNRMLASYAQDAGAAEVETLPTVVDLDRYAVRPDPPRGRRPVACWVGQRATGRFLLPLAEVFAELQRRDLLDFRAIGIDAAAMGLPMDSVDWSEGTEVESIAACDIGIMPLPDTPFERGKCAYKLIQYLACGLPVVASPVGANVDVVDHGVNGFLATTSDEWRDAMTRLATDPELRARMGKAGREKVERHYGMTLAGQRLAATLDNSRMLP